MPEVVCQYQDQTKLVEKRFLLCLNKYVNDYSGQDRIVLNDSCDFGVFCQFIDFLATKRIPSDRNDQIEVFKLMKEWGSHFGIIDSYLYRLLIQGSDGIVIYNGDEYRVNVGCMLLHSGVFREFYKNSCGMVFSINFSFSRESFKVFLDLIHNKISYPNIEYLGDVYDICNCLHCDSLCQLLIIDTTERVLSVLLQDQNDDNIDFSKYERSVAQNIEEYLKNPSFCLVSLPSLCRIFSSSNLAFSLSSIKPFIIGCMKHHGSGAQLLLSKIKYQNLSDLTELNQLMQFFCFHNSDDIYYSINHIFSSFQKEFLSMKDKIETLSEINQQIVSEMNHIIRDKDAIIFEQLKRIKRCYEGEYPFISDPFSGIFYMLLRGNNLSDDEDFEVTASSMRSNEYHPHNVLKNDESMWYSFDTPNSWIQFDFKRKQLSLTSYSLNISLKLKSWNVEGSIDGLSFEIIDNKVDNSDFKSSNCSFNDPRSLKNFNVQPNNKYYRYIRIKSSGKNWHDTNSMAFYRVELFGFVKYD